MDEAGVRRKLELDFRQVKLEMSIRLLSRDIK